MISSDNGVDGVGVEGYASSGHGMPMAWQSQTANSCAAPMRRDMDSFAWASVSRITALARDSAAARGGRLLPPPPLPPPPPGFQAPQAAAGFEHLPEDWVLSSSSLGGGNGTTTPGAFNHVHANGHGDAPSAGTAAGGSTSGVSGSKKRRSDKVAGTDQAKTSNASADSAEENEGSKDSKGEETGPATKGTATGKTKGKGGEPQKEGYVHVRARSGQATNSHSLAEKLRREKISERMKLLQDLVPGCSKVTGKAVMLDEIINYVQSLQRQVEFLSMKLSTVNPRLDLNIESLLAKDILRVPWSPSTTPSGFSFSQEMLPKPSQSGMLQGRVHGMANPDMFRTVMQSFSQEPASQIHHALDGSFHDEAQMAYPPLVIDSEDLSIRPDQDGFSHVKLGFMDAPDFSSDQHTDGETGPQFVNATATTGAVLLN